MARARLTKILNHTSADKKISASKVAEAEVTKMAPVQKRYYCSLCVREISRQENEDYDSLCWECWDDQLTEESDSMFDELM